MLMRFTTSNFLSFKEEQEFSMIPGAVRNKGDHLIKSNSISLLRFATLYGPNAAGKSNLIKAMSFAKNIIKDGINSNSRKKYFRLDDISYSEPSKFEFEINIGATFYAYGFEILLSEGRFTGEWLYELKPNTEKLIFERDLRTDNFESGINFNDSKSRVRFEIYSEDVKDNDKVLFLSEMNRNKDKILKEHKEFSLFNDIYKWFENSLDINFPNSPVSSTEFFVDNDRKSNHHLFKLLDSLDTGITDFQLVDITIDEIKRHIPEPIIEDIKENLNNNGVAHIRTSNNLYLFELNEDEDLNIKSMQFSHGNHGGTFTLGEESDGTRRLLDLLEILIGEDEKVYIIDEIDRSLHPNLTYKFLELFLDMLMEKRIQLIITTHEDRILNLELLRRDEIWFVEKNEGGSSELYSLEKFKTRFDTKILKAYLEGRYGAVPKFKNFLNLNEDGGEN